MIKRYCISHGARSGSPSRLAEHPQGGLVMLGDVEGLMRDGLLLRRFLRLLVAGAGGDTQAVQVLASMEGNNPGQVDDDAVTEELLRKFLGEAMEACDMAAFTNDDERQLHNMLVPYDPTEEVDDED